MCISFGGTIAFEKEPNDNLLDVLDEVFNGFCDSSFSRDEQVIIPYHKNDLDTFALNELTKKAKDNGNKVVSGEIEYYGDYEGKFFFIGEEWRDEQSLPLSDVEDSELLAEVKRRNLSSEERIKQILIEYIDNDLSSADPGYVRDVIRSICSKEEIHELGLYEWLGFDDEKEE